MLKVIIILLIAILSNATAEQGMYPLSKLKDIPLKEAGLKISINEIFNTNAPSLTDALVNIGGCTGSFVSEEGLILTNHHCAFRSISKLSSEENNYLETGFYAEKIQNELQAEGLKVRITVSYEDVSERILNQVKEIEDILEKSKKIDQIIEEIEKEEEKKFPELKVDISEMLQGSSYVLFRYEEIKDVRLVFAPPKNLGNFGGETDNWEWPRHTADFTFFRAYVGKDGKPAEYSEDNIPYTPKKYLKINSSGANEGDFIFILGYPGRTFKNQPSNFLQQQNNFVLPYISNLYGRMIEELESLSEKSVEAELKYAPQIRGLANTYKNYNGKIKGLRKTKLIDKKMEEEDQIIEMIKKDNELNKKFGTVIEEIDSVYSEIYDITTERLWFSRLYSFSAILDVSDFVLEYAEQMLKDEKDRKAGFKSDRIDKTFNDMVKKFKDLDSDKEIVFLNMMFKDALKFDSNDRIKAIDNIAGESGSEQKIETFVDYIVQYASGLKEGVLRMVMGQNPYDILEYDDPLLNAAKNFREQYQEIDGSYELVSAKLDNLLPKYVEMKRMHDGKSFIPDANGTLRLTYGYIRGYNPKDAVYMSPVTTIDGAVEKSYLGGEYILPEKYLELYENKDFGNYAVKKLNSVPTCLLYNTDTSGGNSGSPILNAKGELIGVNFDRTFEATINDFTWDESFSRSIGVDIRYVLWVTDVFGGASRIIKELGK